MQSASAELYLTVTVRGLVVIAWFGATSLLQCNFPAIEVNFNKK